MEGGGVASTLLGLADAGTGGQSAWDPLWGSGGCAALWPLTQKKERRPGDLRFSLGVQVVTLPLQSK